DATKDQSYFLHRLVQHQLEQTLFPLGEITKHKVRDIARTLDLPNATKKDSTGICFIGERPFREFLNRYLPTQPGPIKTPEGQVIGKHHGLAFYTLGQRKGLGIGGDRKSTRLNSSHVKISYAVFCLKKKNLGNNFRDREYVNRK